MREKLQREPVEDFRIDFEDGYGNRPDEEEDGHAAAAADEVSAGMNAGELPPFIGIRIKPLTEELRERSIRTLDIFLTELASKSRGELPKDFCVTLPKVTLPDEVAALADVCSHLEPMLDLEPGALRIETDDRDAASDFQRTRRSESAAAGERAREAVRGGSLRTVRLHGFAGIAAIAAIYLRTLHRISRAM